MFAILQCFLKYSFYSENSLNHAILKLLRQSLKAISLSNHHFFTTECDFCLLKGKLMTKSFAIYVLSAACLSQMHFHMQQFQMQTIACNGN